MTRQPSMPPKPKGKRTLDALREYDPYRPRAYLTKREREDRDEREYYALRVAQMKKRAI